MYQQCVSTALGHKEYMYALNIPCLQHPLATKGYVSTICIKFTATANFNHNDTKEKEMKPMLFKLSLVRRSLSPPLFLFTRGFTLQRWRHPPSGPVSVYMTLVRHYMSTNMISIHHKVSTHIIRVLSHQGKEPFMSSQTLLCQDYVKREAWDILQDMPRSLTSISNQVDGATPPFPCSTHFTSPSLTHLHQLRGGGRLTTQCAVRGVMHRDFQPYVHCSCGFWIKPTTYPLSIGLGKTTCCPIKEICQFPSCEQHLAKYEQSQLSQQCLVWNKKKSILIIRWVTLRLKAIQCNTVRQVNTAWPYSNTNHHSE